MADRAAAETFDDRGETAGIDRDIRAVAASLYRSASSYADDAADEILSHVRGAEDFSELTRQASHANTVSLFDYMARGVPAELAAPTHEFLGIIRALVQNKMPIDTIIHAHRLSVRIMSDRWIDAVTRAPLSEARKVRVIRAGLARFLEWSDATNGRTIAEYRAEAERLEQQRSRARIETLTSLLNVADIDVNRASTKIGYQLRARHVAMILYKPGNISDGFESLEMLARKLCERIGAKAVLAELIDAQTVWCWFTPTESAPTVPNRHDHQVILAVGRAANGIEGFRRSHWEATEAMRVARQLEREPGTGISYQDVEVAAICSVDPDRYRAFITRTLGDLARPTAPMANLRETLAAYYDANSNCRATAAILGIHHNTVRSRIERAEEILDKAGKTPRLTRELALTLLRT